jgi:hypothetical protein
MVSTQLFRMRALLESFFVFLFSSHSLMLETPSFVSSPVDLETLRPSRKGQNPRIGLLDKKTYFLPECNEVMTYNGCLPVRMPLRPAGFTCGSPHIAPPYAAHHLELLKHYVGP